MRPRLAHLRKAPKRERTLLVMIVFVTMFVMNMPTMIVPMMVEMSVPVFMLMGMVMQPLAGPRPARVLAEHKRLDGDRHGVRRHADAAKIDIVEIHEDNAVDDQKLAPYAELFAQDRAQS